jgi:hypothetical protein
MKISPSNLGIPGIGQAFNASNLFPYQWAWNFVGETIAPASSPAIVIPAFGATALAADAAGIKWTPTGGSPFVDCYDELATPGLISGDLNAADKNAYYMHSLFDFSNAATVRGHLASLGGTANLTDFELYWFNGAGSNYEGSDAIHEFTTNGITVLVHDLRNTDGQFGSGGAEPYGTGGDWIDRNVEAPLILENYFHGITATSGQSFVHHGFILADRILGTGDISLPIDVKRARS